MANYQQEIDLSNYFELVKQKVTTICVFGNLQFLPCTTSYGYLAVIDTSLMHPVYCQKVHKGNITSSCFVDGNKYFVTASGSFSQNHDNTINVYLVCTIANDIFFKKMHSFKNAHGRQKGVMNVVSSNMETDLLIISCGNSDDGQIKVFNVVERQVIFQFPDPCMTTPFYNISVVMLESKKSSGDRSRHPRSPSFGEEAIPHIIDMHLLVFATSIDTVTLYEINPKDESISVCGPIDCAAEIGSYLSISMLLKTSDRQFKLLVGNVNGDIETFDCCLDTNESVFNSVNKPTAAERQYVAGIRGRNMHMQSKKEHKPDDLSRSSGSLEIEKNGRLAIQPIREVRKSSLLDFSPPVVDAQGREDLGQRLVRGLLELTKSKRRRTVDPDISKMKEVRLFPETATATHEGNKSKSKTTSQD